MPLLTPQDVNLLELWTAGGNLQRRSENLWAKPGAIRVGASGVYVLDEAARQVYRLNVETGEQELAMSKEGEGPGELVSPTSLTTQGDQIVVLDAGKKTLERFSSSGEHIGMHRLDAVGFRVQRFDDLRLLVFLFTGVQGAAPVQILSPDGSTRPFQPSTFIVGNTADGGGGTTCRWGLVASGDGVVQASCVIPQIQEMDLDGHPIREIVVDRTPEQRSAEEIEEYVDRMRESMAGLPPETINAFVRGVRDGDNVRRNFQKALRDPTSGLFVLLEQQQDEFGGGFGTLHIFSKDGIYLAELETGTQWVDFDFADATLFALTADSVTGLISATAFGVELAPELANEISGQQP